MKLPGSRKRPNSALIIATSLLLCCAAGQGCHSSPADSSPASSFSAAGTYVGVGSFSSQATNVILRVVEAAAATSLSGTIRYAGEADTLRNAIASKEYDTLRFEYTHSGTAHRTWAVVGSSALHLNYIEPAGIPAFGLNRAIDGYNLTGIWSGLMSSSFVPEPRSAAMRMDQQSQLFHGSINVSFLEPVQLDIVTGIANGSGFNLSGTLRVSGNVEPVSLLGNFSGDDTVSGNWQAGSSGEYDRGMFEFTRSFN